MRYGNWWPTAAEEWDRMVINSGRTSEFLHVAQYIIAHKDRYQEAEAATGVPWYMIGVIHWREGSGNFNTYLGNGQLLSHRTTIVPKGRGPFSSWQAGAIDALKLDGLADVKDWRLEKILYWTESFNGFGYELYHHLPSPYVWGGTNIQRAGKYVADGVWNPNVWDPQPGTAPILKTIMALDPTVDPARETPPE